MVSYEKDLRSRENQNERCRCIINVTHIFFLLHGHVSDIVMFFGCVSTCKRYNAVIEVVLTFNCVKCKCRGFMTRSR